MVEYKCDTCNKLFFHKNDYQKHKNRKTKCSNREIPKCPNCAIIFNSRTDLTQHLLDCRGSRKDSGNFSSQAVANTGYFPKTVDTNLCPECNMQFAHKSSLYKHIRERCPVIKRNTEISELKNKLEETVQLLNTQLELQKIKDKQIDSIEKEYKKMRKNIVNNKVINKMINNGIINNMINIQNNIKLQPFGKEDLSYITEEVYKKILSKGFQSVPLMVETVHYNEKNPQNHNIYISNIKDPYVLYFDGDKWKIGDRKNVIDDIFDRNKYILENKYDDICDQIKSNFRERFNRFLDNSDPEVEKNIKNDIKMIMYNNRNLVQTTRNKLLDTNNSQFINNI